MRALIADPDASRRVALETELRRLGYEIEACDVAPEDTSGFDLVCLGGRFTQQRRLLREQTARVAAQAAERRSAFLAEASPLLDASLDLRSTLDSLTRLSVP